MSVAVVAQNQTCASVRMLEVGENVYIAECRNRTELRVRVGTMPHANAVPIRVGLSMNGDAMKDSPNIIGKRPRNWRLIDRPTIKAQLQFEMRDCWIGLFWRKTDLAIHVYVCFLPTIPLHVTILRRKHRNNA